VSVSFAVVEVFVLRHARRSFIAVTLALLAVGVPSAGADTFRVIVHPSMKGGQIPRAALASVFLKDVRRWGDGDAAQPVDQSLRSPIRVAFCREVLRQEVEAVNIYWQRRMSTGLMPPMVKASDEEIISFVASTRGSIGYVSAGTPLPEGIKVLAVID
jgi:hypothetical protein